MLTCEQQSMACALTSIGITYSLLDIQYLTVSQKLMTAAEFMLKVFCDIFATHTL